MSRIVGESGTQTRLEVVTTRGLTPLVGREHDVEVLLDRWAQAREGLGQVVVLSGEAGIGKSRLLQVLKDRAAGDTHTRLECRSSPYYQNTALYPVTELWERLWAFTRDDTPATKLTKMERALSQYRLDLAEIVPLLAALLALPLPADRYAPLTLSPQRQRQKILDTLLAMVVDLAVQQPLLCIVEDLHWVDPSTIEWLTLLIDRTPASRLCLLLTCRPAFQPPWGSRSCLTQLTLNRLTQPQVEQMVERLAGGKALPAEVIRHLVEKADGVPLYIEEMTKAILESGLLQDVNGRYELVGSFSSLAIPATLQDSLMARLDRLGPAKGVAQVGATIGRQFAYELLQAISSLDEETLQRELGRLVDTELVYQRGVPPQATYTFKHALIQDIAYQSLLRSTRQQYHQRMAQVLVERFPDTVEAQPELLAHHYTEAGLMTQAVLYWQRAGQRTIERSANVEAIAYLAKGLELLQALPDAPERIQQELTLQIALAVPLIATKGYASPEVEQAYARAQKLCQHVPESQLRFLALRGLWNCRLVWAELQIAHDLGEQLRGLAQRVQDPDLLVEMHRALGTTLLFLGELTTARTHLEQGMALYDPQQHRSLALRYGADSGLVCRLYAGWVFWLLGYPDQALQTIHHALAQAHTLAHSFTLAFALNHAALVRMFRREAQVAQEQAETSIAFSSEQRIAQWLAQGTVLRGCALAALGRTAEGRGQIYQGMEAWHATGAKLTRPWYLAQLAEACWHAGQVQEGLHGVEEALGLVDTTGERWWEAELHRLKGKLLLALSAANYAEATTCFQHALDIARRQQARSLELRAAMSLARLWQQQGQRAAARQLLAEVYGWFTEGFDTADLQEARALLEMLGA